MKLQEEFPDVYPPIELEVKFLSTLYEKLYNIVDDNLFREITRDSKESLLRYLISGDYEKLYYVLDLSSPIKEHPELGEIYDLYENFWSDHGYAWHYFMAINEKHDLVKAHLGKLELTPENFEKGSASFNVADQLGFDVQHNIKIKKPKSPFIGWVKSDIVDAISKLNFVGKSRIDTIQRYKLLLNANSYGGSQKTADYYQKKIDENKPLWNLYLSPSAAGIKSNSENMAGFSTTKYKSKLYYETIYRILFKTLTYIDWGKRCDIKNVSKNDINRLAIEGFAKSPVSIKIDGLSDICQRISPLRIAHTDFVKSLTDVLPFQSDAVKLNPTSNWILENTGSGREQMGLNYIKHPYERMIFIKSICADDNVKHSELVEKFKTVGMGDLMARIDVNQYSKKDLCDYFTEIVDADAKKYEKTFIYCRDDSITKDEIVNIIAIMDLKSVFKKINVETASKSEICNILENFIQILMEEKALALAK